MPQGFFFFFSALVLIAVQELQLEDLDLAYFLHSKDVGGPSSALIIRC